MKSRCFVLLCGLALAALLILGDYLTGPGIQFPILYIVPVVLLAWRVGLLWGLTLAIVMPLTRLYWMATWHESRDLGDAMINAAIRMFVLAVLSYFVDRLVKKTREVKVLESILPICSSCKKIRDKNEQWVPVETYITAHTQTWFSHGMCPECAQREYPELFKKIRGTRPA